MSVILPTSGPSGAEVVSSAPAAASPTPISLADDQFRGLQALSDAGSLIVGSLSHMKSAELRANFEQRALQLGLDGGANQNFQSISMCDDALRNLLRAQSTLSTCLRSVRDIRGDVLCVKPLPPVLLKTPLALDHTLRLLQSSIRDLNNPFQQIVNSEADVIAERSECELLRQSVDEMEKALSAAAKWRALREAFTRFRRGVRLLRDERKLRSLMGPTGTVTLLFTDIEGSTALWAAQPVAMRRALQMHNVVLRTELARHNGYEVKTEGDAFMIAFSDPTDCLLCCLAIQRALLEVRWPAEVYREESGAILRNEEGSVLFSGIRVRMGFDVGTPDCQPDPLTGRMDYFGPSVNLTARIGGCARGGEIAIGEAGFEAVRNSSVFSRRERGAVVMSRGKRHLKGIDQPHTVYSVFPSDLKERALLCPSVDAADLDMRLSKMAGTKATASAEDGTLAAAELRARHLQEQLSELFDENARLRREIAWRERRLAAAMAIASTAAAAVDGESIAVGVDGETLQSAVVELRSGTAAQGRLSDRCADLERELAVVGSALERSTQAERAATAAYEEEAARACAREDDLLAELSQRDVSVQSLSVSNLRLQEEIRELRSTLEAARAEARNASTAEARANRRRSLTLGPSPSNTALDSLETDVTTGGTMRRGARGVGDGRGGDTRRRGDGRRPKVRRDLVSGPHSPGGAFSPGASSLVGPHSYAANLLELSGDTDVQSPSIDVSRTSASRRRKGRPARASRHASVAAGSGGDVDAVAAAAARAMGASDPLASAAGSVTRVVGRARSTSNASPRASNAGSVRGGDASPFDVCSHADSAAESDTASVATVHSPHGSVSPPVRGLAGFTSTELSGDAALESMQSLKGLTSASQLRNGSGLAAGSVVAQYVMKGEKDAREANYSEEESFCAPAQLRSPSTEGKPLDMSGPGSFEGEYGRGEGMSFDGTFGSGSLEGTLVRSSSRPSSPGQRRGPPPHLALHTTSIEASSPRSGGAAVQLSGSPGSGPGVGGSAHSFSRSQGAGLAMPRSSFDWAKPPPRGPSGTGPGFKAGVLGRVPGTPVPMADVSTQTELAMPTPLRIEALANAAAASVERLVAAAEERAAALTTSVEGIGTEVALIQRDARKIAASVSAVKGVGSGGGKLRKRSPTVRCGTAGPGRAWDGSGDRRGKRKAIVAAKGLGASDGSWALATSLASTAAVTVALEAPTNVPSGGRSRATSESGGLLSMPTTASTSVDSSGGGVPGGVSHSTSEMRPVDERSEAVDALLRGAAEALDASNSASPAAADPKRGEGLTAALSPSAYAVCTPTAGAAALDGAKAKADRRPRRALSMKRSGSMVRGGLSLTPDGLMHGGDEYFEAVDEMHGVMLATATELVLQAEAIVKAREMREKEREKEKGGGGTSPPYLPSLTAGAVDTTACGPLVAAMSQSQRLGVITRFIESWPTLAAHVPDGLRAAADGVLPVPANAVKDAKPRSRGLSVPPKRGSSTVLADVSTAAGSPRSAAALLLETDASRPPSIFRAAWVPTAAGTVGAADGGVGRLKGCVEALARVIAHATAVVWSQTEAPPKVASATAKSLHGYVVDDFGVPQPPLAAAVPVVPGRNNVRLSRMPSTGSWSDPCNGATASMVVPPTRSPSLRAGAPAMRVSDSRMVSGLTIGVVPMGESLERSGSLSPSTLLDPPTVGAFVADPQTPPPAVEGSPLTVCPGSPLSYSPVARIGEGSDGLSGLGAGVMAESIASDGKGPLGSVSKPSAALVQSFEDAPLATSLRVSTTAGAVDGVNIEAAVAESVAAEACAPHRTASSLAPSAASIGPLWALLASAVPSLALLAAASGPKPAAAHNVGEQPTGSTCVVGRNSTVGRAPRKGDGRDAPPPSEIVARAIVAASSTKSAAPLPPPPPKPSVGGVSTSTAPISVSSAGEGGRVAAAKVFQRDLVDAGGVTTPSVDPLSRSGDADGDPLVAMAGVSPATALPRDEVQVAVHDPSALSTSASPPSRREFAFAGLSAARGPLTFRPTTAPAGPRQAPPAPGAAARDAAATHSPSPSRSESTSQRPQTSSRVFACTTLPPASPIIRPGSAAAAHPVPIGAAYSASPRAQRSSRPASAMVRAEPRSLNTTAGVGGDDGASSPRLGERVEVALPPAGATRPSSGFRGVASRLASARPASSGSTVQKSAPAGRIRVLAANAAHSPTSVDVESALGGPRPNGIPAHMPAEMFALAASQAGWNEKSITRALQGPSPKPCPDLTFSVRPASP